MTIKIKSNLIAVLVFLTLSTSALAQATPANDSVRWDANANKWVYTLYNPDGSGEVAFLSYTPRTLIVPSVKNTLHWRAGNFEYSYRIRNGATAKQKIKHMETLAPAWNLPPFTELDVILGETQEQMQARGKAHYEKYDKFERATLDQPEKWESFLRTRRPERVYYGWFARAMQNGEGIEPGRTVSGFQVTRPELPGAAIMWMRGYTEDYMNASSLPSEGAMAQHASDVLAYDSVWIPVLVPAIIVPTPYNGAELARRIKAHMATWINQNIITQETLDRLNRSFDSLIAAQTYNNIAGTREAVREILQEAYSHHRGLDHNKNEEDDDEHDAEPINSKAPATVPINRVAARALSFDLMYLLTRAHVGK